MNKFQVAVTHSECMDKYMDEYFLSTYIYEICIGTKQFSQNILTKYKPTKYSELIPKR